MRFIKKLCCRLNRIAIFHVEKLPVKSDPVVGEQLVDFSLKLLGGSELVRYA